MKSGTWKSLWASARRERGERKKKLSARGSSGGSINETATVFIVAASEVVRAGLESLVAADARFTVAGSAADLSELASEGAEPRPPDVVVFDAERQREETFAALRSFAGESGEGFEAPAFVVIGADSAGQGAWLADALRAGIVRAHLPRAATGGEILAAIEAVSAGLIALDAETLAALLAQSTTTFDEPGRARSSEKRPPPVEEEFDALTQREREVLEMLAEGLSNKEIAWRMKISEHTVKFHVASIFAKLGVSTRTEAVMQGIRRGIVMM